MKYILFIYTIILFSMCTKSSVHKEYYETGELRMVITTHKKGVTCIEEFHKNGNKKRIGCLQNEVWEGEVRTFFKNGKLEKVSNFSNGIEKGEALFYNKVGVLAERSYLLSGKKYYTEYLTESKHSDLIRPISYCKDELGINKKATINIQIPFVEGVELPYIDKEVKLIWNLSRIEGTSSFHFDESIDSVLAFNKFNQYKTIEFIPQDTGVYYLNQLVYFELKDSTFYFDPVEFIVE